MLLVTGATGFLGSNILKEVSKKRADIRILSNDPEAARKMYPKFEVVEGDVTVLGSLKTAGKDVDTVIHLAGLVSYTRPKSELIRVNAGGTKNVLEACRKADKFVFSSSVSVYGEIKVGDSAGEDFHMKPKNAYGESKLEAEKTILDSGMKSVILRIAPVYGAGSPQWMKNLSLLEKGFPIPQTSNLTHVAHVSGAVQAFGLALKPKSKGVFNVADAQPVPFIDFAGDLISLLGKEPRTLPFWFVNFLATMKGMKTYFDVLTMNRSYDVSRAMRELGYDPELDFYAELRRMVEWYKREKQNTKEKGN
jgi:nucleoside-diphosphate-sugar epimerase